MKSPPLAALPLLPFLPLCPPPPPSPPPPHMFLILSQVLLPTPRPSPFPFPLRGIHLHVELIRRPSGLVTQLWPWLGEGALSKAPKLRPGSFPFRPTQPHAALSWEPPELVRAKGWWLLVRGSTAGCLAYLLPLQLGSPVPIDHPCLPTGLVSNRMAGWVAGPAVGNRLLGPTAGQKKGVGSE